MRYAEHVRKMKEAVDDREAQTVVEIYDTADNLVKTRTSSHKGKMDHVIKVREKGFGRLFSEIRA